MVQQPFSKVPEIPSAESLIDVAVRRSLKASPSVPLQAPRILKVKRIAEARIRSLGDILCSKLNSIYAALPSLRDLHSFYKSLLGLVVEYEDYSKARNRLKASQRIIRKLIKEYSNKVRGAATPEDVTRIRREAYGRILSVIRRIKKQLDLLEEVRKALHKVPSVDPQGVIVVVAGYPNVGKSTFVSKVSTAKPKIAEYPFTTTEIIVGHLTLNNFRVQVIDTPGLLDRPIYKRNRIERMAIAAIEHLADSIVFIIDPSETSGYTIEEQLSLLNEIKSTFKNTPIILALNKVDVSSPSQIKACEDALGAPLFKMVAKDGVGIREVLNEAIKLAKASDRLTVIGVNQS